MAPDLLRRLPPPWMSAPTKGQGSSRSTSSTKTDPFLITLPKAIDPDGTCLALLARATYKDLISQPSYPRPVLRPPTILHRVAPAGGAGLGVFALQDLAVGELVFSERPLLVVPTSVTECEWEACAARLPPAALGALVALADIDPKGGSRPAARRIRTNGVRAPTLCSAGTDYLAVGALSARAFDADPRFDSCTPNAVLRFDSRALTLELRVLRYVLAGDELRVSYMDAGLPLASRRAALAAWRFTCDCSSCASGDAGDTLRARIRVPDLKFISSPAVAIQRCVLQLMQLERAGLEVLGAYGTCLGLLAGLYGRIGDRRKAKEYKRKADAWTYALDYALDGSAARDGDFGATILREEALNEVVDAEGTRDRVGRLICGEIMVDIAARRPNRLKHSDAQPGDGKRMSYLMGTSATRQTRRKPVRTSNLVPRVDDMRTAHCD
ncbi:hypothetical protein K523DRAFT_409431 [Schizophyllum commune Tattone D]|nr:hypothetical protein K523DRAFT_409431 [Schizophyllum commune Tattone D]